MPTVTFMAWVNRNDVNDPGHLVMVVNATGHTLEYGMGGTTTQNFSTTLGTTVRAGGLTSTAKGLVVTQKSVEANVQFQKDKMKGAIRRFTHVMIVEVDVTDAEFAYLRKMGALRIAAGSYSFLKELQVKDPLATRCLSSLEDLARMRSQKLGVGKAEDLLETFATLNDLPFKIRRIG